MQHMQKKQLRNLAFFETERFAFGLPDFPSFGLILIMSTADIHILHKGDFYRVVDFKCHCRVCSVTAPEYNNSFTISFIRKGFFEYQTYRRNDEVHAGRFLISKPGYEHTTRHIDNQPDIVTIFDFKRSFYEEQILDQYGKKIPWILKNHDIHSLMVNTSPE